MTNKIISSGKGARLCLAFAFLLGLSIHTQAQDIFVGARGGLSIPNLSTASGGETPLSTGYKSRLGADAAVFMDYGLSKRFSLEFMVQYSEQGGKKNGLQAFTTPAEIASLFPEGQAPAYLYANYKSESKLNYLMMPLLLKYGWDINKTPLRIYVAAGPFVAFLLTAKQVTSGSSLLYTDAAGQNPLPAGTQSFDNTSNVKDQLHAANVGLEANIGISYRLWHGNLFVEGGGNYGFINIQKNTVDGKNNTGAGTVALGYSYRLGK